MTALPSGPLVALAGSPRLDQQMALLLAEMRLVFHRMPGVREFHEPYLAHNARIWDLATNKPLKLTVGKHARAEKIKDGWQVVGGLATCVVVSFVLFWGLRQFSIFHPSKRC
jgi:hypothetical protein